MYRIRKGCTAGPCGPGVRGSFFLNLKMERVWRRDYANHREVCADITDCTVGSCNTERMHSMLGNRSPNDFE